MAARGHKDDRGNTVFYNLDYKDLKDHLPDIIGSDKPGTNNYQCFHLPIDDVYVYSSK